MSTGDFPSESLQDLDALFDLSKPESLDLTLRTVVELALRSVPAAAHSSVTLGDSKPNTIACSDDTAKLLDAVQFESNSGPSLEAFRRGETVKADDLLSDARWPRFAEKALQSGVRGALSLPLSTTTGTSGALNLYSDLANGFDSIDEEIGGLFASRAAVGLANAELFGQAMTVCEQLREALTSRDVIGQAKGLIMANEGCTDEEAFKMLVTASQHSNRKLREIAQAVLDEHASHIDTTN